MFTLKDAEKMQPKNVWKYFWEISQIPRETFHEAKISDYLEKTIQEMGYKVKKDAHSNIVAYVPGSVGRENEPYAIFQAHMDMVATKNPGVKHDFLKDPIVWKKEGDWITADGTTLGADNGIGVSVILAIMSDKTISHPPLTCILTTSEESSPNGSAFIPAEWIKGSTYFNLDTQDVAIIILGSGGGFTYQGRTPYITEPLDSNRVVYAIDMTGLIGKHSGVMVSRGNISALDILINILYRLHAEFDMRLIDINTVYPPNYIPPTAHGCIAVLKSDVEKIEKRFKELVDIHKVDSSLVDPKANLQGTMTKKDKQVQLSKKDTTKLLQYFLLFPKGVRYLSFEQNSFLPLRLHLKVDLPDYIAELVDTSVNLSTITFDKEKKEIFILAMGRSNSRGHSLALKDNFTALSDVFGIQAKVMNSVPLWQFLGTNSLVKLVKKNVKEIIKKPINLFITHAELESGDIINKIYEVQKKNTEAISIGPTIRDPHSPDEKVNIPSVEQHWEIVLRLLKHLNQ